MYWTRGTLEPIRQRPGRDLGRAEKGQEPRAVPSGGGLSPLACLSAHQEEASGSQPSLPTLIVMTWRELRELFGIQIPLDPPVPAGIPFSC